MIDILHTFLDNSVQVYLDDIVVYSKTDKGDDGYVRVVLRYSKDVALPVSGSKSDFFLTPSNF